MSIKNVKFSLAALLLFVAGFSPIAAIAAPTPDDYWVFNQVSNDRCVNILISTKDGADKLFIYNGEAIKIPAGYLFISDAVIHNNHIGYIAWKTPLNGGVGDVFVDGKQVGTVVGWADYNPMSIDFQMVSNYNYHLNISDNHVAYLKLVGFGSVSAAKSVAGFKGEPIFHMMYDDKDLGEVVASNKEIKMNGDYIIYVKKIKNKEHLFANTKDLGVGIAGDFDGKNKAVIQENLNLIYNGKKLTNLGASGLSFGAVELKNGLLAYNKGPNSSPSVFFKGKKIGSGRLPRIEGKNFAYLKGKNTLVYNNKNLKNLVGINDFEMFSLGGKHFAHTVEELKNQASHINIDGETYVSGGDYDIGDTKVQVSEKLGCIEP